MVIKAIKVWQLVAVWQRRNRHPIRELTVLRWRLVAIAKVSLRLVGRHLGEGRGGFSEAKFTQRLLLLLKFVLQDVWRWLDVSQAAPGSENRISWPSAPEAADAVAMDVARICIGDATAHVHGSWLAVRGPRRAKDRAIHIFDGKLGHRPHLAANPAGKDLAALLLVEPTTWEVAFVDKGYDVNNNLVLVENRVDDDWHDGRKVCFAGYLHEDDNKPTGLEDGAEKGEC